jgi:putative heme iron utilization protein
MNKKQRVTTTNDASDDVSNVKAEVVDGAIRVNAAGTAAAKRSEEQQPPSYKSIGMDNINNDAKDNTSNISSSKLNDVQPVQQSCYSKVVIIQQMDNLQEDECHKPTVPKLEKSNQKDFFVRVDKLKAYKEKHGHINIRKKENESLYGFCRNLRQSRTAIITGKGKIHTRLDDDRIAALDAIGFDWNPGASTTVASKDDKFFTQVDKLRAYKEKHGHLNMSHKEVVSHKEDRSLYYFCNHVRQSRQGKKGTYMIDDGRIAALDAIGFNWNPGTSSTAATTDDTFLARVDKLKAYKEKHGHINIRKKENESLYGFCRNLRQSRTALVTGKGKIHNRLDDDRIAALDAIGFDWNPGASTTVASKDDKFFTQVDKLRAYKEKHGHLNMSHKEVVSHKED